MKERISYIDVAKGILIIFVVLGHITGTANKCGIVNNYLNHIGYSVARCYAPFYMQAFFFLTGYTSNFSKPIDKFIITSLKKIILPYLIFSCFFSAFNYILFDDDLLFNKWGKEKIFFLVESFWFLPALFIAKVFFYFLYKIDKIWMRLFICLILMVIGISLNNYYYSIYEDYHYHNYFHYRNAMCMVLFMCLGNIFFI